MLNCRWEGESYQSRATRNFRIETVYWLGRFLTKCFFEHVGREANTIYLIPTSIKTGQAIRNTKPEKIDLFKNVNCNFRHIQYAKVNPILQEIRGT